MKQRIGQNDFSGGYNTRDDQLGLAENQCLDMCNCYPVKASVRPRSGISMWASNRPPIEDPDEIVWEDQLAIQSWTDDQSSYAITIKSGYRLDIAHHKNYRMGIFVCARGSNIAVRLQVLPWSQTWLWTGSFDDFKFSFVRIKDSLLIFCSDSSLNCVLDKIAWDGHGTEAPPYFSYRAMWMPDSILNGKWSAYPDSTRDEYPVSANTIYPYGPNRDDSLTDAFNTIDGQNVMLNNIHGFQFVWAAYGVTLVRRTNTGDPFTSTWDAGTNESPIDMEKNVRVIALGKRPVWGGIPMSGVPNGNFVEVARDGLENSNNLAQPGQYAIDPETGTLYWNSSDAERMANQSLVHGEAYQSYDPSGWRVVSWQDRSYQWKVENPSHGPVPEHYTLLEFEFADDAFVAAAQAVGATHLRVYRTLEQTSFEAAKGSTLRFLFDIPLTSLGTNNLATTWPDATTDAELSGSDNSPAFIGTSPAPDGVQAAFYHNGKVWVGGADGSPGRAFFSAAVTDPVNYLKFMTHFNLVSGWIDCNQNTGDVLRGIGESQGNLILMLDKSIWTLFRGLVESGPRKISSDHGILGRKAYVQRQDFLYLMTRQGPAMIYGDQVQLIEAFSAGELWPRSRSNTVEPPTAMPNVFETSGEVILGYVDSTLVVFYGGQYCIGFRDMPQLGGIGPFRIEPMDALLRQIRGISMFGDEMMVSLEGQDRILSFLDRGARFDLSQPLRCSVRTHKLLPGKGDLNISGELWDLLAWSRYENSVEPMQFTVRIDDRYEISNTEYLHHPTDSMERGLHSANGHQFAFEEGTFGGLFDIEFSKLNDVDFDMNGVELRYFVKSRGVPKFTVADGSVLREIDHADGIDFMSVGQGAQPFIVGPRN